MAIHTSVLQAHIVLFAVGCYIQPVAFADHFVAPIVEHLHVCRLHVVFALDTLFLSHLIDGGGVDAR